MPDPSWAYCWPVMEDTRASRSLMCPAYGSFISGSLWPQAVSRVLATNRIG